jgi:hypothetical protein
MNDATYDAIAAKESGAEEFVDPFAEVPEEQPPIEG